MVNELVLLSYESETHFHGLMPNDVKLGKLLHRAPRFDVMFKELGLSVSTVQ